MSLKHGLLGLLTLRKSSGYDLSKLFQESLSFFWVANQSQIYRELDKMEDLGWVVSSKVEQDARPNKRVYGITKEGNLELIRWLKEENAEDLAVARNPLLMKLFFSGKVDREYSIALLKNYRKICEEAPGGDRGGGQGDRQRGGNGGKARLLAVRHRVFHPSI